MLLVERDGWVVGNDGEEGGAQKAKGCERGREGEAPGGEVVDEGLWEGKITGGGRELRWERTGNEVGSPGTSAQGVVLGGEAYPDAAERAVSQAMDEGKMGAYYRDVRVRERPGGSAALYHQSRSGARRKTRADCR